ncbi:MAG: GFA family protein [Dongiaceae bacterium]
MTRKAECSCGQLSIATDGDPKEICVCNCLACQKYTGSAFGIPNYWPKSAIVAISGESRMFRRVSDANRWIEKHFRPVCGDTIYRYVEFDLDAVGIPVGNFADPLSLRPQVSYWARSKHSWVTLPEGLKSFETE